MGDIDLWYGDDKAGLKKIAEKHPEVLDDLQGIIDNMHVVQASENRVILESDTHKAVVSKDWYGKKADNWLLTAYEKKGTSGGSIDIVPEPEGMQNGTAPLQDSLSGSKDSESSGNSQANGDKNAMPMRGEGEKAEPDFMGAEPERSFRYIYDELGLSQEEAEEFIDVNKKSADDAYSKLENNRPKMTTHINEWKEKKASWEAKKEEAKKAVDYWEQVSRLKDNAIAERKVMEQRKKWSTPEGRKESLSSAKTIGERKRLAEEIYGDRFDSSTEAPLTAKELVSLLLPYHSLTWNGYERGGTHIRGLREEIGSNMSGGIGRDVESNSFNTYLAKNGEGKSVEGVADEIYRSAENTIAGVPGEMGEQRFDAQEIRNAIIELITEAQKPSDISDFWLNSRIDNAERAMRAEEEYAEHAKEQAAEAYHLTPEELDIYDETFDHTMPEEAVRVMDEITAELTEKEYGTEQNQGSADLDSEPAEGATRGVAGGSESEVPEPAARTAASDGDTQVEAAEEGAEQPNRKPLAADPLAGGERINADARKQAQLKIVLKNNPAEDGDGTHHTWIRTIDDVKTYEEAMAIDGATTEEDLTPDFTKEDLRKALEIGEVTVYSSKPIGKGIFVTPSRMEAESYAGDGKVYSKRVRLEDVAWIDSLQGQYAPVENEESGAGVLFREGESDYSTMSESDLDKEYMDALNVVEKPQRIEKLRQSEPLDVVFSDDYLLERGAAKKWAKENVKGTYTNADTKEEISVSNVSIDKVTSHGEREEAHLKAIKAIPQMVERSIFIDEVKNEKENGKYDSYRYYVCGLTIDGVPYTAKVVVGVKNGRRYYDHELTQIEKGELIDSLNGIAKPVAENNSPISGYKDTRLLSILQTKSEEIARAKEKMRGILDEIARRRGYTSFGQT